ncbi:hypothetical protein [Streptacidiphilus rugosus]|uniref:hypothetical protein n=1 Tax=Streptacidiphilus rugosus TaxID=405783 RepID=UPI0012F9D83D|nr:hypothetical protein [Streptacidiphilus rugosus]
MNTRKRTVGSAAAPIGRHGIRVCALAAAAAIGALAAGCASGSALSSAASGAAASASAPAHADVLTPPSASTPPGMPMPGAAQATAPSATALMVCSPEIRKDVTKILTPANAPTTTTTWTDHLYTCTYHLPTGQLVLTVKESPDAASATSYFEALRTRLGRTTPLTVAQALGNPGYESPGGTVVILKDGKTLRVDATRLPAASGPHHLSRSDLAYEIASDILGCWNE